MKDSYSILTICNFCGGTVRVMLHAGDHAVRYLCSGCGRIWGSVSDVQNHCPTDTAENIELEPLCDDNIGMASYSVCKNKNFIVCFNSLLQSNIKVYKYKANNKLYIIDDDFCDIYRARKGCDLWHSPYLIPAGNTETVLGLDKCIWKRFFDYFDEPDECDCAAAGIPFIFDRIGVCRYCLKPFDPLAPLAPLKWITAKTDTVTGSLFCRCDTCGATWENAANAIRGAKPSNLPHASWVNATKVDMSRAGWDIYKTINFLP
jgi:hypothetical protein